MPQVVDDDGDVVVQLALLLVGGDGEGGVGSNPTYHHKPTSSTLSLLRAALQNLGAFSESNCSPPGVGQQRWG